MTKIPYNSIKRCLYCQSPEHCFTKSFTARNYNEELVVLNFYNQFWLCQNPACVFSIKVEINVKKEMVWDNKSYWWRSSGNTEMNIRLARRYDIKHGIINSYYG